VAHKKMEVREARESRKTLGALVYISVILLLFYGYSVSTRAILMPKAHDHDDVAKLLTAFEFSHSKSNYTTQSFNCTSIPTQIAKARHYFYLFGRSRVKVIMEVCAVKGWKWEFLPNNTIIPHLMESAYTDSLYIIQDRSHIFGHGFIKDLTGSKHVLVSTISEAHKVTGSKNSQLTYSRKLAKSFGCTLDDLKFIPKSFLSTEIEECSEFVAYATRKPDSMWLLKPYKGICGNGIKIYRNSSLLLRIINSTCGSNQSNWRHQYVIQEYLPNLLLLNGRKFDIRAYVLIARTNPYFVFYYPGFLRLAVTKFSKTGGRDAHLTNIHIQENTKGYSPDKYTWSYDELQQYLSNISSNNDYFVRKRLEPIIKQTAVFLLQAGKPQCSLVYGWHWFLLQIIALIRCICSNCFI